MFNILDIFRTPAAAPIPATPVNPAPTGVNNPGTPLPGTTATPGTAPNGVIPANAQTPPENTGKDATDPRSLLDAFSDTWKTAVANPAVDTPFFANLDPVKVMESAKQADFSKALTPELLQKIAGGGQEAVQALSQALNSVSQTVYGQGTITTAKLIDTALAKQREQFVAQLPNLVKQHTASERIRSENPLSNHPAVQPIVSALQAKLSAQHPNASSAEIEQQVNQYLSALGQLFGPKPTAADTSKPGGAEQYDFSSFLNM